MSAARVSRESLLQPLAPIDRLHNLELVLVELGPDPLRELLDLRVCGGSAQDHLAEWRDACLHLDRVAGVEAKRLGGVRLLQHRPEPGLVADGHVLVAPSEVAMPERTQQPALRLEGEIDGLEGDPGLLCDRRHRGRDISVADEEVFGRVEDRRTRRLRLLLAARGVVAALLLRGLPAGGRCRLGHCSLV